MGNSGSGAGTDPDGARGLPATMGVGSPWSDPVPAVTDRYGSVRSVCSVWSVCSVHAVHYDDGAVGVGVAYRGDRCVVIGIREQAGRLDVGELHDHHPGG